MEAKYYTPEIEEFYPGFEYESYEDNQDGHFDWKEWVFFGNPYHTNKNDFIDGIKKQTIRVKHLDRQDIEECGWELDSVVEKEAYYIHKDSNMINGENRLIFREKENTLEIIRDKSYFSFYGTIKNKSELKKLMKQLNIQTNKR